MSTVSSSEDGSNSSGVLVFRMSNVCDLVQKANSKLTGRQAEIKDKFNAKKHAFLHEFVEEKFGGKVVVTTVNESFEQALAALGIDRTKAITPERFGVIAKSNKIKTQNDGFGNIVRDITVREKLPTHNYHILSAKEFSKILSDNGINRQKEFSVNNLAKEELVVAAPGTALTESVHQKNDIIKLAKVCSGLSKGSLRIGVAAKELICCVVQQAMFWIINDLLALTVPTGNGTSTIDWENICMDEDSPLHGSVSAAFINLTRFGQYTRESARNHITAYNDVIRKCDGHRADSDDPDVVHVDHEDADDETDPVDNLISMAERVKLDKPKFSALFKLPGHEGGVLEPVDRANVLVSDVISMSLMFRTPVKKIINTLTSAGLSPRTSADAAAALSLVAADIISGITKIVTIGMRGDRSTINADDIRNALGVVFVATNQFSAGISGTTSFMQNIEDLRAKHHEAKETGKKHNEHEAREAQVNP